MTTETENPTTVTLPPKAAATRQTILSDYRKIVEKITNLKPVLAKTGRFHPMWKEYQKLKYAATLHIVALRIVKTHPEFVGLKGHMGEGEVSWTSGDGKKNSYKIPMEGIFDYADGSSTQSPVAKMLPQKKAIVGQHLPHGASAASFLKKAWQIVKKAHFVTQYK